MLSEQLDDISALTMQCRTAIGSSFECPESGGIFTIELGLELFMIGQIPPLMVVWHCSALHVRKWTSTYPLRLNGNRRTGEEEFVVMLPLDRVLILHRLLYQPQLVVDGNMKLVHLIMKRPSDDVSLSDGELFMVRRTPYADHLASAPERQPVSAYNIIIAFYAEIHKEIKV
jgi:hypothetical protein